jgi:hypothetical protein
LDYLESDYGLRTSDWRPLDLDMGRAVRGTKTEPSLAGMADYHKASGGGDSFSLSNLWIRATQASCDANASLSVEDRSHSPVNQPPQTLVSNSQGGSVSDPLMFIPRKIVTTTPNLSSVCVMHRTFSYEV